MHITRDNISDITVARIVGTLDSKYAKEVHDGIVPILLDRQPILLDFTEVPHVSQDGLRTMLAIYRQAQAMDGKVCVVGVSGELHLALSATGFLRFFIVADDIDHGIVVLQATQDGDRVPVGAVDVANDSRKTEESVAS
jgi:anti-sigma B factor antagonist